jgi:hydrogenase maturation protein HypF
MQYEGQAAMELEALAVRHGPVEAPPGCYVVRDGVLDLSPLVLRLLDCRDPAAGAALFHAAVAAGLAEWVKQAAASEGLSTLAVGGGCALNAVLMTALRRHLAGSGIAVLEARQAPPGDGGLALGQAWVARRMFKEM